MASGKTSSRSSVIALLHLLHLPYSPLSIRLNAFLIRNNWFSLRRRNSSVISVCHQINVDLLCQVLETFTKMLNARCVHKRISSVFYEKKNTIRMLRLEPTTYSAPRLVLWSLTTPYRIPQYDSINGVQKLSNWLQTPLACRHLKNCRGWPIKSCFIPN